ncbi:hypothetical protein T01_10831 [Trichinella spiralis]|uniref:Uncharacterized protein n=1 Tax=Trichinella spiralis TaxID=6334 RepID=A0A0V1BHW7_TRISP|nr:hypothetical protein T01_10831 [Trichinella spiralis]
MQSHYFITDVEISHYQQNCFVFCLSRKRKYFFQSCGIALMSKKRGNMLEMGCGEFFNNYFICDCFNLCTHTAVWIRML